MTRRGLSPDLNKMKGGLFFYRALEFHPVWKDFASETEFKDCFRRRGRCKYSGDKVIRGRPVEQDTERNCQ